MSRNSVMSALVENWSEIKRSRARAERVWHAFEISGYWIAGLFLFVYGLFTGVTSGIITNDEIWFLQVAHRLTSGDILYRDIFFGVTPLSAYIAATFITVFGTELLIVKVIMALCFAATCLLTWRIAQQLHLGQSLSLLILAALLAYVPAWVPGAGSPYTPMSYVFSLICFSAILSWRDLAQAGQKHRATIFLAMAGASAGLGFATKQSLGFYSLIALWLAVLVSYRDTLMNARDMIASWLATIISFLFAAGLMLLPVWLTGGTDQFLDYAFLNKETYIRLAQITYPDQLTALAQLARNPMTLKNRQDLYMYLQLLLPFLTFPALLWAWLRASPKRGMTVVIIIFTVATFADVFPRVSIHHTTAALPTLLLGLAWAWRQIQFKLSARGMLALRAALLLWFAIGVGTLLFNPARWIASGAYRFSFLPHVRGVLAQTAFLDALSAQTQSLAQVAIGDQLLIINPSAGLYYLITGLKNPTPFDYPLVTAFGRNGQGQVIAAIQQQQIRSVCLTPLGSYYLKPALLEDFVQEHMEPIRDLGFCTLYHTRP